MCRRLWSDQHRVCCGRRGSTQCSDPGNSQHQAGGQGGGAAPPGGQAGGAERGGAGIWGPGIPGNRPQISAILIIFINKQ